MSGIRGVDARIEFGPYGIAARLQGYTVTCDPPDRVWRLRAILVTCDRWQLQQRPLRFVAPHANGTWTWPVESVEIINGSITATLGTPWTSKKGEC